MSAVFASSSVVVLRRASFVSSSHLAGPSQQYFLPDLFAYRPRPGYEQKFKIWASRRIHFRPKAGRHSVVWGDRRRWGLCHFIPISRIVALIVGLLLI
jgi:hypothetical protein